MFIVGDTGLEWVTRAAHTAASLQGIINRLMADTKIVMSILNNEMLRGHFGEVMHQSRSTVRTWVEKKHTALLTSDS